MGMRFPGPTLREVCSPLIEGQLQPEALRPFVGHPTLRDGTWGLCSDRKNIAAWDLLPLGDPPFNHPKSLAPDRFRQPR